MDGLEQRKGRQRDYGTRFREIKNVERKREEWRALRRWKGAIGGKKS